MTSGYHFGLHNNDIFIKWTSKEICKNNLCSIIFDCHKLEITQKPNNFRMEQNCCSLFIQFCLAKKMKELEIYPTHWIHVKWIYLIWHLCKSQPKKGASHVVLAVKNPPASAGDLRDTASILGLRRSQGCHGNLLRYSCLENPVDRDD